MLTPDDCFRLGTLTRPHGVRGELRASLAVQTPQDYAAIEEVLVARAAGLVPYKVEALRLQPGGEALLTLRGVATREKAEALAGAALYLPLALLPALPEGKFYYHEIIGLEAVDAAEGPLGQIADVLESPGQDLLRILTAGGQEILAPLHDDFIEGLDRAAGALRLRLPPGLVALYLGAPEPPEGDVSAA